MSRFQAYDAVFLKSVNTRSGSAGTFNYLEKVADAFIEIAKLESPIGTPGNRRPDEYARSEYDSQDKPDSLRYINSFVYDRIGGNQYLLRRVIYNISPYAKSVERGRRATTSYETFYASYRYRKRPNGTRGWFGFEPMQKALARVLATRPVSRKSVFVPNGRPL